MINLIPTDEKKKLFAAYQKRFYILMLAFSACVVLIGSVFLFIPYIVAGQKITEMEKTLEITKTISESKISGNPEFALKDLESRMEVFSGKKKQSIPSAAIFRVLSDRPKSVRLTGFTYSDKNDTQSEMEVRGVADSRDALLSFVRALEGDSSIIKVNLPVSNFLEERDISFTMAVLVKRRPI